MLSDTIHDSVHEVIKYLARCYVDDSYNQDQIEEAMLRLVPIASMANDLDIGGDGVPGEGSSLTADWAHAVDKKPSLENWVLEKLWSDLYDVVHEIEPTMALYRQTLPTLKEYFEEESR